jgi:hypothetical protein
VTISKSDTVIRASDCVSPEKLASRLSYVLGLIADRASQAPQRTTVDLEFSTDAGALPLEQLSADPPDWQVARVSTSYAWDLTNDRAWNPKFIGWAYIDGRIVFAVASGDLSASTRYVLRLELADE